MLRGGDDTRRAHRRRDAMTTSESDAITFRPAQGADALCLGVLSTQVFLDTYAPQGISPALAHEVLAQHDVATYERALADPRVTILVAECAGCLVGFSVVNAGVGHDRVPGSAAAELHRLYVQERFTGRGVGRDLLRHAEKAAAARGADALWLTAWCGNARALLFYPRCGYDDLGATMYSFGGEDYPNRVFAKRVRHVAPA
jgi:diamine N-acetyltransferase